MTDVNDTDALPDDADAQMADANAPRLAPGDYVAAVLESKKHVNDETGSLGFKWRLRVSKTQGEYDPANTVELSTYTWLGYENPENPAIPKPSPKNNKYGYAAMTMVKALTGGLERGSGYNVFNPDHNVGRLLKIRVKHETSEYQGEEQTKAVVQWANPFRRDDQIAPRAVDPSTITSELTPPSTGGSGGDDF